MSLMYHDVVDEGRFDSSGFPGRAPARYKLGWPLFVRHLEAISETRLTPGSVVHTVGSEEAGSGRRLFLTFDDGGASALRIGVALSEAAWVGHFFVPADFIGKPGFLDAAGIAELARMGHVIGTHSCSHPVPISRLPEDELLEEWSRSIGILSEITGTAVVVGSVPGGYSSRRVVRAAALAGLEALFTSEPVATARRIDGCLVLGRYAILAETTAETAARLARGELLPRLRQLASWKAKGIAKAVLGDAYRSVRTAALERS